MCWSSLTPKRVTGSAGIDAAAIDAAGIDAAGIDAAGTQIAPGIHAGCAQRCFTGSAGKSWLVFTWRPGTSWDRSVVHLVAGIHFVACGWLS